MKKKLLGAHIQGQPGIKSTTLQNTCNNTVMLGAVTHAMSIRGDTAHARLGTVSRGVKKDRPAAALGDAGVRLGWPVKAEGLQQGDSDERSATWLLWAPWAAGGLRFRAPRLPALLDHHSFLVPLQTVLLQPTAQQAALASFQFTHTFWHLLVRIHDAILPSLDLSVHCTHLFL